MAEMGKSIGQRYPYAQAPEKDSPFISKALGQGSSGSGRDKHQSLFAQQCQVNPLKRGSGEHLAYIIYTSGSTGQPKGVALTHNALAAYCQTVLATFDLQISDRVLQFHTLLFDVSLEEILPTLIAGAQLVLREREVWTPTELAEKALRFGLTVLDLPTAYWHQLAQDWFNRPPERLKEQLRLVIIGGERVVPKYLKLWFQTSLCPVRLISAYGPTETTIAATMCNLSVPCEETEVPIGRPLAGGSMYVLDGYGNPVPIGVAGELFIGGDLLARGYLNRADMTAERFVPNPFGDEEGSRLYKTGDLVHYLPDGNLVFLGRMDQQVKIRGYRIELGEIETALQTHPAVQEAVVLAREDIPGEKRLVAYVVGPQEVTAAGLRSFLHEKLPAYMIPSQFLLVDAIPLTPSGKLDRKALPAPQVWCGQAEEGQQGARTGIEEVLVELWGKVLGHTQVGIHDTFFELGGHSLLATQLLARVRAVLGIELAVRVVFEAPTVAELAQRVEQALRKGEGTQIPPLVARARPEVLPLSFAQQRLWFLDQFEPGSPKYLVSNAVRIGGKIDVRALQGSLQELISRHESLRTTFEERDGQPVQVIHPAGPYLLPVIDLQGLGEKEREQQARRLASQERQHPCNLATGPLLRTYLLRLEPQEDVLLLTLHHIITDGWSNEVLVRELTLLYQAFLSAQPSPLAPLPLQYVDYALWQRAWFQGEVLEAQLDYWTRRLGGAPPIKLPTDYPRPPVVNSRGASHPFALPADLSRALVALSRQEDVTLFMLLLAAFQVLFYRYTGQLDIVIGTDSANRHRIETEEIIGFFVNLLVLRTDLSGQPTFREVLKRVREVALGAYAHQDTPFDLLVEKLASDRYLDRMPIVQVLFVLQNISLEPVRGREIEHEAVSQPSPRSLMDEETTVKFDLALFMWERGGKLFGNLNYRLDLFKASTIATMVARFEVLLQSIVKEPDMPIDLLECVSDAECIQQEQEERALRSELLQRDDGWFDLSEKFFTKNSYNQ
jgi:surfactin family lipopeptide synthetase A